jgi:hypothetical protein
MKQTFINTAQVVLVWFSISFIIGLISYMYIDIMYDIDWKSWIINFYLAGLFFGLGRASKK